MKQFPLGKMAKARWQKASEINITFGVNQRWTSARETGGQFFYDGTFCPLQAEES